MSFVNLNGKLLNEKKAAIPVNNRSFRYGDGCFETIRVSVGTIPLWSFHWERLTASLQTLQFELPSFFTGPLLQQQVMDLVQRNGHTRAGRIRLTLFRGNGGLYDPENHRPNYLIQSWALPHAVPVLNNNGLVAGIYEGGFKAADGLANIKSNNYLLYALAALHAKQQQWNEALVLNHRGSIADATIANLFLLKDGMVLTPPLGDGPVAGTLRRYLLEQLPGKGYSVAERSLYPQQLGEATAAFLTNAIYGIQWVKQIGVHRYEHREVTGIYEKILAPLFR